MRILVVSDLPQFVTGGAEQQAASLICAWADSGHEVVCFGRRMGPGPVRLGRHTISVRRIHVARRLGRALRGITYLASLAALLLLWRRRVDVIYTRFLGEAALVACALRAAHLLHVVIVATPASCGDATGGDMAFLRSLPFTRRLIRLLDSQCDAINLIAPAMAAQLRGAGFSGSNFSYIPNGVLVRPRFPSQHPQRKVLISVVRIAHEKGIDVLIEAMALIKDLLRPSNVRIVGSGEEAERLKCLAKSLGIDRFILWLGQLKHDDVMRELERAQVFVLPSRFEGMSNAGLEAMERGLTVILTACGGLDAYIHSDMGWVVPPADVGALASALRAALTTQASTLHAMGERCRTTVRCNFDVHTVASQYTALFRSLRAASAWNQAA